jgi:hypothetical protein
MFKEEPVKAAPVMLVNPASGLEGPVEISYVAAPFEGTE